MVCDSTVKGADFGAQGAAGLHQECWPPGGRVVAAFGPTRDQSQAAAAPGFDDQAADQAAFDLEVVGVAVAGGGRVADPGHDVVGRAEGGLTSREVDPLTTGICSQ